MIKAKNLYWILINVTLAVVVFVGISAMWYLYRSAAALQITRSIVVSADGRATLLPDIARVSFSVVSEGKDPQAVQSENVQKMNSAIEFVKGQGVASADIKTSGYDLSPKYEYDEKKRTSFISGYTLTQTVSLKLRNFDQISVIIGNLPSLGINRINQVGFEVEDQDKYLNQARAEAFALARGKADAMAAANGARLGRVVTFQESQGGIYPRVLAYEAMGAKAGPEAPPSPQIEPGSEEVTVSVSVTYELR